MAGNKRIIRLAELVGGFPRGANVSIDDMEKRITREIKFLRTRVEDLEGLYSREKIQTENSVHFLRNFLFPNFWGK